MSSRPGQRSYPIDSGEPKREPDYGRVVRGLSDQELEDESLSGRGDLGYRLALVQEDTRRAQLLYPPDER
jgi:hypothetical protein